MNTPVVELCVIADDKYYVPLSVMLTSAKVNKQPSSRYRIHLMHTELGAYGLRKLMEIATDDFEIINHPANIEDFYAINSRNHVSKAALLKFRLSELLPTVERVLYLDGDIIVRQDLSELFFTDLGDNYIAGVRDMAGEVREHFNELVGSEKYINSGVILMNLSAMRADNLAAFMLKTKLESPPTWKCMDQDTINYACKGRTLYLPFKYNCTSPLLTDAFNTPLVAINEFYGTEYCSWEEMNEDAVLVHPAGPRKPWKHLLCSQRELWLHYYQLSPFGSVGMVHQFVTHQPGLGGWPPLPQYTLSRPASKPAPKKKAAPKPKPPVEQTTRIRLFHFIPFLKVKDGPRAYRLSLFDFIPLLTIIRRPGLDRWRLFAFIPLFKIKK